MKSALWLLTLVSLFNYIDRFLVGALAPRFISHFHLTHLQGGFLISAFMVGYMIFSPIFGPLGDRKNRPRLMALGIFGWAIFTALCGFATSFLFLLALRVLGGVGEASFASLAPTYLRDLADNDRTANRAFSIFYLAIPLGAAMGFLLGGAVVEGDYWNLAFVIPAVPGALLAIFTYRLKDSARTGAPVESTPLFQSIREIWKIKTYRGVVLGYIAFTFAIGGFAAWVPEYGISTLGVTGAQINSGFGLVTVLGAVIGTLIGGRLGTIFLSSGLAVEGFCLFGACCSLFALPFAVLAFTTHSLNSFLGFMLVAETLLFASTAPINTAIVDAVPRKLSTTAMAFSTFMIHAFGDFLSPPAVGLLSDIIPMRQAILMLPGAILISAIIWGGVGKSHSRSSEGYDPHFLTPFKEGVGRFLQWILRQATTVFFERCGCTKTASIPKPANRGTENLEPLSTLPITRTV